MEGIITKTISNSYQVEANNSIYNCHARGKFKNNNLTPLVGDRVIFNEVELQINEILPRKNRLLRPMIANVDIGIVVTSLKEPDYSSLLLDKMLINLEYNNIKPVICITKSDLLNDSEKNNYEKIINYYKNIGYIVLYNNEIDKLYEVIKNRIVVLTGQTGAGKSTLINKLLPNLNLETNEISHALGRGKHTTRHVELYHYKEALIADTPGFSALDINMIDPKELKYYFKEFDNNKCKYRDCMHINEKDCKIIDDVNNNKILRSRYDSYKKMVVECESFHIYSKK